MAFGLTPAAAYRRTGTALAGSLNYKTSL